MLLTDYFRSQPDLTWQLALQSGVRHGVIRLPEDEENALADICEKYLLAQLDCGFKTLSFYHEVKN